jgi:uncharacterized protein (TIGR00369 family)
MRVRVVNKQRNSRMCLVCGLKNPYGLMAAFHEMENGELVALFTPHDEHQGYPGLLHGGITTAILDETIGRAIVIRHPEDIWGVTVSVQVRFRRPIPLNQQLRVIGRVTRDARRFFEGSGELYLPDGRVAAEATGRYMRLPLEQITDFDFETEEWRVTPSPSDPTEVDIPDRPAPGRTERDQT